MDFSSLVGRIDGEGAAGWAVHFEARQAQDRGEDVVILSVGDPDVPTPEAIVEAAVDALRAGDTHYTDIPGRTQLRQLVAERFSQASGGSWDHDNVMITAGTQNALFAASLCLLETGTEVIALDPMYLTYEATLSVGGAAVVPVRQEASAHFRLDSSAIEAAVTRQTRLIALTTPNNPTGSVATREELEAIAEVARRHDLWVLADEVYADLVFEGEHVSIASLTGMAERTVTVSSLSKSHAMTGWRVGWAIGPTALIEHMGRLGLAMSYGLPGFVQEAAIEAFQNPDSTVDQMREMYRRRRDVARGELGSAVNLPLLVPEAGMYVLADVRGFGMTGTDFAWELFRRTGVSVLDAGAFGSATDGWIRISFTIGDDALKEGCRRIAEFTRELTAPEPKQEAGPHG